MDEAKAKESQIGFLDLPPEIRLMIYENLFNTESIAEDPTQEVKYANALFTTCSQIFSEAVLEFNKVGQRNVKAMWREWDTIRQKKCEAKWVSIMLVPEKLHQHARARNLWMDIQQWSKILKDVQVLEERVLGHRRVAQLIETFN